MANDFLTSIDFNLAVLDWETKDASHGLWRVIASAAQSLANMVEETRFVLTPMVMAGDVYGSGKFPLSPAFSCQFATSTSRHIIFRNCGEKLPRRIQLMLIASCLRPSKSTYHSVVQNLFSQKV